MVTRIRDQVQSFIAYGGYKEGMSVGEILDKSRADRLITKELEKSTMSIMADLVEGKTINKIVEIPAIDWKQGKYNIRGSAAVDIANEIEQSFRLSC